MLSRRLADALVIVSTEYRGQVGFVLRGRAGGRPVEVFTRTHEGATVLRELLLDPAHQPHDLTRYL
jgi:hypothetical protein